MKETIKNDKYGEIIYEENFWSGKKKITFNGKELLCESKNKYSIEDKEFLVKGNFISGVKLNDGDDVIIIVHSSKWYEIAMSIFIFAFILVWGNSPSLCRIIPVIGGAIGGGISGLFACVNLIVIKNQKNVYMKILASFGFLILTFGICFLIGYIIIK